MPARERRSAALMLPLAILCSAALAEDWELAGYVALEPRLFVDRPQFSGQPARGLSWSGVLAPELRREWDDGRNRVTLAPFVRIDQHDRRRSHADLREASWQHVSGPWTVVAGVSKVFWGVTEARHLVDIVNQTDLVEDLSGDEKLGQPMLRIERWGERGTVALFVLPGFRERTFPADDARLRGTLPIATGRAQYESGAGRWRVDLALRWAHATGPFDLGLSAFHGTSREPRLVPTELAPARVALVPHYDVITQAGAEVQYTRGAWLGKLEAILRRGHGDTFGAAVAGFEYTFFGVRGSAADVGLLAEYLYDGRGRRAPPTIFDDDVFVGLRLALNDPDSTMLLAGVIVDRGGGGTVARVQAERRLGAAWKLEFEARSFHGVARADPMLGGVRNDSFVMLRIARFF